MLDLAPDVYSIHRAQIIRNDGRLGDHAIYAADQLFAALCIIAERHANLDLTGLPRFVANGQTQGTSMGTRREHVLWLCSDIAERVPGSNMQAATTLWIAFAYSIATSFQVRRIVAEVVESNRTVGDRVRLDDDFEEWAEAALPTRRRNPG
jgi:hypothetical protein